MHSVYACKVSLDKNISIIMLSGVRFLCISFLFMRVTQRNGEWICVLLLCNRIVGAQLHKQCNVSLSPDLFSVVIKSQDRRYRYATFALAATCGYNTSSNWLKMESLLIYIYVAEA